MSISIPYNFPGAAGPALLSETVSTRPVVVLLHGLGGTLTDWTRPQKWGLHYNMSAPIPPPTVAGTFPFPLAGPAGPPLTDPLLPSITTFDRFLNDNGFQTLNYDQTTPRGTLAAPALELAALMRALHAHPLLAERSFVLLCHSRGGLLARKFLKDNRGDPSAVGRITKVITLCTPHAGSAWGNEVTTAGTTTITMAALLDIMLNARYPGIGPVVTTLLSPLISYTTTPAFFEMRVGGPFITDLASGEEPLPGVEYHTFGGTSVAFTRLIDRVYTLSSVVAVTPTTFFYTHVVISVINPFQSPVFTGYPPVNSSFETMTGFGDFLVSDASSRLPFETSHQTLPVNHAEVMWDPTAHQLVLDILRGADVWNGWTIQRAAAVDAQAHLSLVRDESDRLLLFAGNEYKRRWRRELAPGDPKPPGLARPLPGESPGWSDWTDFDQYGMQGFAAEFDKRQGAGGNRPPGALCVFATGSSTRQIGDWSISITGPEGNNVWARRRVGTTNTWTDWTDLGGTEFSQSDLIPELKSVRSTLKGGGQVVVVRNDRGALELFAPGTGGRLWTARENAQGTGWSFSAWEQTPVPAEAVAAAVLDDEGAVLVFVHTSDWKLDCYRRPPGGVWTQWALPDEPGLTLSRAIQDAESKIVLLARSAGGLMYWTRQRVPRPVRGTDANRAVGLWSGILAGIVALILFPVRFFISLFTDAGPLRVENKWEPWMAEEGSFASALSAELNSDGPLEVVARGEDGRVFQRVQTVPLGDWTPWKSLGGDTRGNPVLGRLANGRLAVLAISTEGNLRQRTQTTPGRW
jgi:pimeloyl-ACP methyl ester carboxylesterase